jgi:cob(I)alamin adenosyltransferase
VYKRQIKDDTGEIAVVTERSVPRKGEQIKVIGKVEEAFSLGDQQLIVIKENPARN